MNDLYNYITSIFKKEKEEIDSVEKELSTIEFIPTNYPSDLTDEEWNIVQSFFPYGNKSIWHKRSLVNAVLYIIKTGCQWRMLPKEFPSYNTVWSFFRRAKEKGIVDKINDELVKITRIKAGRKAEPTYAIVDSQSVKTVGNSEERGIDGGKKTKGRKRHIVVDVMGNLLAIVVHAANIHDTKSGILPTKKAKGKYPSIVGGSADMGYRKTYEEEALNIGIKVTISERIAGSKFEVQPKRWVVERTFGWLNNSRRLSKDYEITISSAETMITISHSVTLLRRLCKS